MSAVAETPALERAALLRLADSYAEREELWRPHVRVDAGARVSHPLLRDASATVWLLCWMPGQDTGFHDHDGAAGAVRVIEGAVAEERLGFGGPPIRRVASAGEGFEFGGEVIHRVSHAGGEPAVTIHAYSPALRRMGAYTPGPAGELVREILDESQELGAGRARPDAGAVAATAGGLA